MTSTRLPGKVLLPAGGRPLLAWHVQRLQATGLPVLLATTTNADDDSIAAFALAHGLSCSRGSEPDVLSRYWQCAQEHNLDIIVRVTSDCPLIAPELVAEGIARYRTAGDARLYLSNTLVRTYPRGFDFEIFSRELLEEANRDAVLPADREHVTPYIHQNRSGTVRLAGLTRSGSGEESNAARFRLTVDEPIDYELVRTLIDNHGAGKLNGEELIALLERHPKLAAINAHVEQKKL